MMLALRRLLERLSRGVVFRRRLPSRFGRTAIYVSPEASLKYFKRLRGKHFDDLFDFAETHVQPGNVIWDVGSNIGVFSFCAAFKAGEKGRVLAIEADAWSVNLVRRSIQLNPWAKDRISVLQVAAVYEVSVQKLNIPDRSRAATHLQVAGGAGAELIGSVRETHLVPALPLDLIAKFFPAPAVLKIDVDGAELRVLEGASRILREHRPKILIEVFERNADEVTRVFHDAGYDLFDFNHGDAKREAVPRAVYNTLAVPRRLAV